MKKADSGSCIPAWIKERSGNRSAIKFILSAEYHYADFLKALEPRQREDFVAISENMARGTLDQQEAFLLKLPGFLADFIMSGPTPEVSKKVCQKVADEITHNPSFDEFRLNAVKKGA